MHAKVSLVGVGAAGDTLGGARDNRDNFAGAVSLRCDAIITVLVEAYWCDLALNNDGSRDGEGSKEEGENGEDADVLHFDLIYILFSFSGMISWFLYLFFRCVRSGDGTRRNLYARRKVEKGNNCKKRKVWWSNRSTGICKRGARKRIKLKRE